MSVWFDTFVAPSGARRSAVPGWCLRSSISQSVNHGETEFLEFPREVTSQTNVDDGIGRPCGIFVHRKFPLKKIGQSENCGDLFALSLDELCITYRG